MSRLCAMPQIILKLGRLGRDVIDDHVRDHGDLAGQCPHILPSPKRGTLTFGVIARIESSIGAIDRQEERQDMNTPQYTSERTPQQGSQTIERAAAKTIGICNELRTWFFMRGKLQTIT